MFQTEKIMIQTQKPYPVFLGVDLWQNNAIRQELLLSYEKIIIVTEHNLKNYGMLVKEYFQKQNPNTFLFVFKGGEKNKNRRTKALMEDFLMQKKCVKDSCIVAVGGGLTCDLAGFVAANYCRGIASFYVPTSLLAMVDATIGGKTGINTKYGKNLLGAFYQPSAVFIDLAFLKTLRKEELLNGLVEAVKYALIKDQALFLFIKNNLKAIKNKNLEVLFKVVLASLKVKKAIVEHDELEKGERQICNFGHTTAHALEIVTGYKIKHGFAVALGIEVANYLAVKMGILKEETQQEITSLWQEAGVFTKIPLKYDKKTILNVMCMDKKAEKNKPHFVLLQNIGLVWQEVKTKWSFEVDETLLEEALTYIQD